MSFVQKVLPGREVNPNLTLAIGRYHLDRLMETAARGPKHKPFAFGKSVPLFRLYSDLLLPPETKVTGPILKNTILRLQNPRISYGVVAEQHPLPQRGERFFYRQPFGATFHVPVTDEMLPLTDEEGFIDLQIRGEEIVKGEINIGWGNWTEDIRQLQTIHGLSIKDIERWMSRFELTKDDNSIGRLEIPVAKFGRKYHPDRSWQGFIGDDERLIDVLAKDNDFVRDHKLTHRDLARCLYTMRKISDDLGGGGKPFSYRNCLYRVYGNFCKNGVQGSPFGDPVVVRAGGIEVKNLTTGQRLTFHRLLPHLICWYGFYEGKTEFRVEPRDIIEMFGLKK